MEFEPNNIISQAFDSKISSAGEQSVVIESTIERLYDVDLFEFQLDQGEGITLDIEDNTEDVDNFDFYLRVFAEDGNELAFNTGLSLESEESSLDSDIGFIANQTGTYYVGVSSIDNVDYNPVNEEDSNLVSDDFISEDYQLNFEIVDVIADQDNDNTISEAIAINLNDRGSNVINSNIDTALDTDMFAVSIGEKKGIRLRANGKGEDSSLDSYLRLFDSEGNELAFDDNSTNNLNQDPANITTNATINFAPPTPGEYFIGVSSAGNFDYDPINGNTNLNLSPNTGVTTGNYALEVDVVAVTADEDADNTISEAIESGVSSLGETSAVFTQTIDSPSDVDLYQIQLEAEEEVIFDIDAASQGSELDSFLRLFDSEGNEIDNNDDLFAGNETSNKDSLIEFTAEISGEYYLGVSSFANFEYDPINGSDNFSNDIGTTSGDYELTLTISD